MNTRFLLALLLVGCGEETADAADPAALGRLVQALGLGSLEVAPNGVGSPTEGGNGLGAPAEAAEGTRGLGAPAAPGGLGVGSTPDGPSGGGATCAQACARGAECFGASVDLSDCVEECEEDIGRAGLVGQALLQCVVNAPTCDAAASCLDDASGEDNSDPVSPGRDRDPAADS